MRAKTFTAVFLVIVAACQVRAWGSSSPSADPKTWTVDDVQTWLESQHLQSMMKVAKDNQITGTWTSMRIEMYADLHVSASNIQG